MMQNSELTLDDQGAIMASLDPLASKEESEHRPASSLSATIQTNSLPDVLSTELQSLNLLADHENNRLSFLLLDVNDKIGVSDYHELCRKLGCDPSVNAKVVSILGNSGDGKSYALNQTFFQHENSEEEVFPTSSSSDGRCTFGVWAAFEPRTQTLVLDTEGMLGISSTGKLDENQRSRQLLKVLAISDVVIFKTRAERIQSDLIYFLGDASKAYNNHFSNELRGMSESPLGPSVIIFHETRFTKKLQDEPGGKSPETILEDHFTSLNQDISAFSHLRYFGVQREGQNGCIDEESQSFAKLRDIVKEELEDNSVRSARGMELIFKALCALNEKFSGDLSPTSHRSFPDEYFTCRTLCSSCDERCVLQLNHEETHKTTKNCVYNKSLGNQNYLCLRCFQNGRRNFVVPKANSAEDGSWVGLAMYAWSGSVLECRICGVIYRSRQHWFGNETPEATAVVHTEISHIWPGVRTLQGTHNAARKLLDGVNCISSTVSAISTAPSKSVSGWVADRIAPSYWRPNADISNCQLCDRRLDGANQKIHHCRACGEGFCHECSDYKRPVPERGWGPEEAVRVCRDCYGPLSTKASQSRGRGLSAPTKAPSPVTSQPKEDSINARRYGEKVISVSATLFGAVLDYPLNGLKDLARPTYWVPDEECLQCCVCQITFEGALLSNSSSTSSSSTSMSSTPKAKLHHCRQCGQGVCDDCSRGRKPVAMRGWDTPVRVCDSCLNVDMATSVAS